MANTTAHDALSIHGTNPQFLVERVIRTRIYDSTYWKQDCFALTAATLVDKAVDLTYVGGTYGALRPSPFLCLVCKLLQLQPDRDVVLEYLAAEDLKYLRALAAMYIRLTFPSMEVYELLEPLLDDYRKLRWRDMAGQYSLSHMDEFVDQLLTEERVCDLILPRLTKRAVLERKEGLRPRISKLEEAMVLGQADGMDEAYDSDESIRAIRSERQRRVAEADALRAERQARTARARGQVDEYESQQSESDEERLHARILRSRTPSVSPDRSPIAAPSRSPSPAFRSRSPSPAFRSRSPSRSPEP
ncbi:hypothetical protein MCAP1_002920 [Malassezia caprae]|uniref:Pre-mRNA-splicing factor 38 n=1 Tax=Malassezia caprae TaxID=1381934 RepID=A0AAF0E9B6_9BASI|nr:hypothetical protein MCAP1_002920 [Malassezia caprae]